jgi:glycerophosphoryl diester phosphodiesterase
VEYRAIYREIPELMRRFRRNWRRLLVIHLTVTVLVFTILTPLAGLLLRLTVRLSGSAALSDTDILFFVLSPVGFVALLLLGSLFSIIVFLEHAALLVMARSIEVGTKISTIRVLRFLAGRSAKLFRLALLVLLRVLANLAPFALLLGVVYLWLLSDYDINYYLAERPSEWRLAVMLGLVLGAICSVNLLRLFMNWIFCLPLALFSSRGASQALADSQAAVHGHRKKIGAWLLSWVAANALLTAAVSGSLTLAGMYAIPSAVTSISSLLLALGLISLTGLVLYFGATFAASALLSLLIWKLFAERGLSAEMSASETATAGERLPLPGSPQLLGWSLTAGFALALAFAFVLIERLSFTTPAEVVAHRGASGAAPENTLAAIQLAIDGGAHWVEIDVQETADGRIVVIHDSDLKKVGDSTLIVGDSTLEELRAVDVGSWFGHGFADQRIPTLEEVLSLSKNRIGVNIELKYYGGEVALEQRVIDIVEQADMADQVVAMSLSYRGIQTLRRMRPNWTVGLLSSVAVGQLAALDVDFLALSGRAATRRLIRQAHQQGKQVMVWTVNDAITMASAIGRGADALITDEPALAVTVLQEFEQLEPSRRLLIQLADFFDRPGLYRDQ